MSYLAEDISSDEVQFLESVLLWREEESVNNSEGQFQGINLSKDSS